MYTEHLDYKSQAGCTPGIRQTDIMAEYPFLLFYLLLFSHVNSSVGILDVYVCRIACKSNKCSSSLLSAVDLPGQPCTLQKRSEKLNAKS